MEKLTEPKCSCCGSKELLVAQEITKYFNVTHLDKDIVVGYYDTSEDSYELFCFTCGEYFEVPENYKLNDF